VVLAIDVRGNAVDKPRAKPFEDYCTLGIESPDTYVYREIVGHALRALEALAEREEADPTRLAVVGVSEGGGVGLMLAALDSRVRAVSADAPMLVEFPLSLRSAAWPYTGIAQQLRAHPEQAQAMTRTLSYFDVVNFAPEVRCPALISVGFLDQVSLPAAVYGMYNRLGGPKEIRPFPRAGHEGGGQELWAYKLAWLAKQLAPAQNP
jgi:cephalosporin-C deacetylase